MSDDTREALTDAECDAIADQVSPRMAAATEFQRIRQRALIRAGHAAALREDRGTAEAVIEECAKIAAAHRAKPISKERWRGMDAAKIRARAAPIPED